MANRFKYVYNGAMKRIFLICFMVLNLFGLRVFAGQEVMPYSTHETKHFGIGVIQLPNSFTLYSEPNLTSKVYTSVDLEKGVFASSNLAFTPKKALSVYLPASNLAYINVLEDDEDNNWFKVVVDKSTGQTAWLKLDDKDLYYTWREFFNLWGRKNGLYFLKFVPEANKSLYSSCTKDSQQLPGFDFPKYISLSAIKGNWAMVTVVDIGDSNKIGWLQWRSADGELYLFPSVDKKD